MNKKFLVRRGVFIKTPLSTDKIIEKLTISMLPLILVKLVYNIETIITLLVTIITFYLGEYLVYYLRKKKKTIKNLTQESFTLYSGLLIYLFTPLSTPVYITIILTTLASILKVLLGGFGKYKLNPYIPSILIMILIQGYYSINPLILVEEKLSTYIILLNIIAIGSLMYLIYNNSIKYRITISHLLTTIILISIISIKSQTLGLNLITLINSGIILISIYLASDSITTPVTTKGQIIYGISLGIISILLINIFPTMFAILPLIIMPLLTKPIDNYFMTK